MAKRGDDRILTFAETEEDWGDNGSQGKTLSVPLGD